MATTTTKSKSTKTTSSTTKVAVTQEATDSAEPTVEKRKYRVKQNLDPNTIVTVRNGYQGKLIYVSRRTQERFIWESFGDEQDMDLQELKNAKNSSKAFFENNWFLIDDPEILEYLGVSQYYKYALNFDAFNDLFDKSPDEIKDIISHLSTGQKKSVAYRAKQLIADQVIDSIKVITALEESLSIELVER
jgi:hypothetical protein